MTWKHKTIGLLAALLGVDLEEAFRTTEHVPYVEHIPIVETKWKDPLEELHDLPDEDGKIYCWELSTEEAARQFNGMLREEFVEKRGREPRAIHLVITEEEQLRELEPDKLRAAVRPFGGDR